MVFLLWLVVSPKTIVLYYCAAIVDRRVGLATRHRTNDRNNQRDNPAPDHNPVPAPSAQSGNVSTTPPRLVHTNDPPVA